jgi:hypothetical protein
MLTRNLDRALSSELVRRGSKKINWFEDSENKIASGIFKNSQVDLVVHPSGHTIGYY